MREGEPADGMFVVVSGRLRVATTGPNGAEVVLAELGVGETVGEMAVISGEPRSATVYAIRDSQLARLSTARFEQLLERHPKGTFQMVTSRMVAKPKAPPGRRRVISTSLWSGPTGAPCRRLQHGWPRRSRNRARGAPDSARGKGPRSPGIAHGSNREGVSTRGRVAGEQRRARFVVYESEPVDAVTEPHPSSRYVVVWTMRRVRSRRDRDRGMRADGGERHLRVQVGAWYRPRRRWLSYTGRARRAVPERARASGLGGTPPP